MSKLTRYFVFTFFFSLLSCSKEKSPVPSGFVDIQLDLNKAEFNSFILGTHIFITGGGSGLGIVVYRFSNDDFRAFDRMCTSTSHVEHVGLTNSLGSNILLECGVCRSRFSLIDGSVISGPARFYLTEYQTYYNAILNTLWITN